MYKRMMASLLLLSFVMLTSCAREGMSRSINFSHEESSLTSAVVTQDFGRAELMQLEEKLAILESKNEAIIASAEAAGVKADSQIDRLEEEAEALREAYAKAESERAALAKQYQAYKNEVADYVNSEKYEYLADTEHAAVEPYREVTYQDLRNNETEYYMEAVSIQGRIIELSTSTDLDYCLIAAIDTVDSYLMLELPKIIRTEERLEVGDELMIYGISYGLIESQTTSGASHITPGILVDLIRILP